MEAYLRSFLLAIAVFSDMGGGHRPSPQEVAALRSRIAVAAERVASIMIAEADTNRDGHVSWEEFCEWYDMGGHAVAPWIELLNVRKWVVQEPANTEAMQGHLDEEEADADADADADAMEDQEIASDTVLFRI